MARLMHSEPAPLGAPTDEEKHDAILVLEQEPGWLGLHSGVEHLLALEATRILDEAGSA